MGLLLSSGFRAAIFLSCFFDGTSQIISVDVADKRTAYPHYQIPVGFIGWLRSA
jgi:hypothetical protein